MTAPVQSMSFLPWREDIPRGGVAREAAVVTLATTLHTLNHVEGLPGITLGTIPATGAAVTVVIGGTKANVASSSWNLTGQDVVPPFRKMVYLLLMNQDIAPFSGPVTRAIDNPTIYAAVPTELSETAQRWAPNGPEAYISALNRNYGYACAGYLVITNNTPNPWTPGTAFPAAPFEALIYDGFPGDMLLPFSPNVGIPPGLFPR